jgi:hypothetical protein
MRALLVAYSMSGGREGGRGGGREGGGEGGTWREENEVLYP